MTTNPDLIRNGGSDREEECVETAQQHHRGGDNAATWYSSSPGIGGITTVDSDLTRRLTLTPPPMSESPTCNNKLEAATICSSSSATVEMVESESESSSSSLYVAHGDASADADHEVVLSRSYDYEDDDEFGEMQLRGLEALDKAALAPFYEDQAEESSSSQADGEEEDDSLSASETQYMSPNHGCYYCRDCNSTPLTVATSTSESSWESPASFFSPSIVMNLFDGSRLQEQHEFRLATTPKWTQDVNIQCRLKLPKGTSGLYTNHHRTTLSKVLYWLNEMYFATMAFILASFNGKNSMEKVFRIFLSLVVCTLLLNVAILLGHYDRHAEGHSGGVTTSLFRVQLPVDAPSSSGRSAGDSGGRLLKTAEKETILRHIRQPSLSPLWDPAAAQDDDGFAVRVMASTSKNRPELLRMSLQALESCPSVRGVEVEFGGDYSSEVDDVLSSSAFDVSVRRISDETSSEAMGSSTAVLLLSDDIVFSCEELQRAFSLWLKNPKRMVGFFPYRHETFEDDQQRASMWQHFGMPSEKHRAVVTHLLGEDGPYHLVSDRAVFVHSAYLSSRPLIRALHGIAQEHESCRSLALSLAVTSTSSQAPLAVSGSPLELRSSTLSKHARRDEEERRLDGVSDCLQQVMFGFGLEDLPEESATYIGAT